MLQKVAHQYGEKNNNDLVKQSCGHDVSSIVCPMRELWLGSAYGPWDCSTGDIPLCRQQLVKSPREGRGIIYRAKFLFWVSIFVALLPISLLIDCNSSKGGNASTSPPLFAMSGAASGEYAGCSGMPMDQNPSDVTSKLSAVAKGVTVTQLTDSGGNWNTYADIPAYSSAANAIVYNHGPSPAAVAISALNGANSQIISGRFQGTDVQVTRDGQFAYFQGQSPNGGRDVYAVHITQSGPCQRIALSQLNMRPIPPAFGLIVSTSSYDSVAKHNVIAFSEGQVLHRALDDGTSLPDLKLPDPENGDVFHRMRLNPVFPDILAYKRDASGPNPAGIAQPEIWVVNLKSPSKAYSVTGSIPSDHASWSNDGTKLGYIYNGQWYVANVLNQDGTFKLNADGGFTLKMIGPSYSTGFTVNFCALAPDASVYVCSQSNRAIYLMSLDGAKTKFLASPDSAPGGRIYNGIPKPRFLDSQHIVFSSDRTGVPEIYVITGFKTDFP